MKTILAYLDRAVMMLACWIHGHSFEEGKCLRCDEPETSARRGG